ncbi:MAG: hypothetical protein FWF03_02525 [Defluviitaleaceae bacterium]|nr:hypothetical protein [Defluviitaleaceae bacterium]
MPAKNPSLLDRQRIAKPMIEDEIPKHLDANEAAHALEFIAKLRAGRMAPGWAGFTNAWKALIRGRTICYIKLGAGSGAFNVRDNKWIVAAFLENLAEYEDETTKSELRELLWDNVLYCAQKPADSFPPEEQRRYALKYPCNLWNCAPGKDVTVCGKKLTNICRNGNRQHFWFHDPDEVALDGIMKLIELEKSARANKK